MNNTETGQAPTAQTLDDWFLNLLECPGCEEHLPLKLTDAQDALHCACGRYSFPVRDGIPILLVEEATVLNADADPGAVKKGAQP